MPTIRRTMARILIRKRKGSASILTIRTSVMNRADKWIRFLMPCCRAIEKCGISYIRMGSTATSCAPFASPMILGVMSAWRETEKTLTRLHSLRCVNIVTASPAPSSASITMFIRAKATSQTRYLASISGAPALSDKSNSYTSSKSRVKRRLWRPTSVC